MTAPQRIGAHLPELLEELAAPRVPDYLDDLLRTTAATRQRPAWASLERWLPVASISRPAPFGLPSWQPLVLLVALLLAAAIGGALLIGAQPRVPAPFGPAQNGVLLVNAPDGTLLAVDPSTATASAFGQGSGRYYPWYSPDGRRMLYLTKDANGVEQSLFVADADGSNPRAVPVDASTINWTEWSPSGSELLLLTRPGPDQQASLYDVMSGQSRPLDFGDLEVADASFRPNGELVFRGHTPSPSTWGFYVSGLDEIRPRALTRQFDQEPYGNALSPDGTTLAYSINVDPPDIRGQVHLVDVTTGTDRAVELAGYEGTATLDMISAFSPDGAWLLLNRFDTRAPFGAPVLVRVDGTGREVRLTGRPAATDVDQAPEHVFSPDGSTLVLRYAEDLSVWIYDVTTGVGRQVPGIKADGLSWQRR